MTFQCEEYEVRCLSCCASIYLLKHTGTVIYTDRLGDFIAWKLITTIAFLSLNQLINVQVKRLTDRPTTAGDHRWSTSYCNTRRACCCYFALFSDFGTTIDGFFSYFIFFGLTWILQALYIPINKYRQATQQLTTQPCLLAFLLACLLACLRVCMHACISCVKNDSKWTNHVSHAASQSAASSRRPTMPALALGPPPIDDV
jgi:hypothetical protein